MDSSLGRCTNCSLRLMHLRRQSLREVNNNVYNTLAAWIAPTPISCDGFICTECFGMLQETLEAESVPAPLFGHTSVCFVCGISILRQRTSRVPLDSDERNIILRWISPHLATHLNRVCRACWMAARRIVQRQTDQDVHRVLETGGAEMSQSSDVVHIQQHNTPAQEIEKPRGLSRELPPERILAAQLYHDILYFLVKWQGCLECDVVLGKELSKAYPNFVIKYYESCVPFSVRHKVKKVPRIAPELPPDEISASTAEPMDTSEVSISETPKQVPDVGENTEYSGENIEQSTENSTVPGELPSLSGDMPNIDPELPTLDVPDN